MDERLIQRETIKRLRRAVRDSKIAFFLAGVCVSLAAYLWFGHHDHQWGDYLINAGVLVMAWYYMDQAGKQVDAAMIDQFGDEAKETLWWS